MLPSRILRWCTAKQFYNSALRLEPIDIIKRYLNSQFRLHWCGLCILTPCIRFSLPITFLLSKRTNQYCLLRIVVEWCDFFRYSKFSFSSFLDRVGCCLIVAGCEGFPITVQASVSQKWDRPLLTLSYLSSIFVLQLT